MALSQTDVADLSAWHRSRKASLIKLFGERVAERKVVMDERKLVAKADKIVEDIKKHKLLPAKKEIDKFLETFNEFLKNMEEVANYNFKLAAAVAYSLEVVDKISEYGEQKHLVPKKMAEETRKKIKEKSKNLEDDMAVLRLMATKLETVSKKAA